MHITDPSGMLQLGARFYWPEVGRFVQQDPIGDGINWYVYGADNPLVWIDPEGLGILSTLNKPFEALGAWLGDTIWPDESDPHPCAPGTTEPADCTGPALMGAGAVTIAAVEGAKRWGHYGGAIGRVGPYAQGAGGLLGLVGAYLTYSSTKSSADTSAAAKANQVEDFTGTEDDLMEMLGEDEVSGVYDPRGMWRGYGWTRGARPRVPDEGESWGE